MVSDQRFQVTRSGREVYGGDLDGLVESAAQGLIRANDLVYDPTADRWLFARNLPALAGFALRGRRAVGTEDAARDGPIVLDQKTLEKRAERRRRAVRSLLFMTLIGITLALVMMVPTTQGGSKLGGFIEDREAPPAEGPRPASEAPANDRAVEGAAGGATAPSAGAGAPPPTGEAPAAVNPEAPTGRMDEAPPAGAEAFGAPAPAAGGEPSGATRVEGAGAAPPAELIFDYARRDEPGVMVEPTDEERQRYAARYTSEGMRALTDPRPPPGDARMAQLLAARHRAEFARLQLEALDPKHPDIEQVERLIDDLESEFTRTCQPAYGERFCGLKLQYPDWPDPVVERVAAGQAELGMTAEQAREAWGRPTRFRRDGRGRRYCYDFLCDRSLLVVDRVVVDVVTD